MGTFNKGVEFLAPGGRIIEPNPGSSPPRSRTGALTNMLDPESFDASGPLNVRFTAAQTRVTVHVGLHMAYGFDVVATLSAYTSSTPGTGLIESKTLSLGQGPAAIQHAMTVTGSSIGSVSLQFAGAGADEFAFEVIDDLTFSTAGPACGGATDTTPPEVQIVRPATNGLTFNNPRLVLSLLAIERESSLAEVEVQFLDSNIQIMKQFLVCGGGGGPGCSSGSVPDEWRGEFWTELPVDTSFIRLRARDIAGNYGLTLRRLDLTVPPSSTNLWVQGMEVTQGIQSWVARSTQSRSSSPPVISVPATATSLVENKRTVVRVYPGLEGSGGVPVVGASARLTCRYGQFFDTPCPGPAFLKPVLGNLTVDPADALTIEGLRGDPDKTWNFWLPPAWLDLDEFITLSAEVSLPPGISECAGCEDGANELSARTFRFRPVTPLTIVPIWACVRRDPAHAKNDCDRTPTEVVRPVFHSRDSMFVQTFPVPSEDIRVQLRSANTMFIDGSFETGHNGAMTSDRMKDFMDDVCNTVLMDSWQGRYPDAPRDGIAVYFGIVPNPITKVNGYGRPNRFCAIAKVGDPSLDIDGDIAVTAQEVGHALGFEWHASCVHGEDDAGPCLRAPTDFPYVHGGIGSFGMNTFNLDVIDPRTGQTDHRHDFMSYGRPMRRNWISDFTHEALFSVFRTALTTLGDRQVIPALQAERPSLWVRVRLEFAGDEVVRADLQPAYVMPDAPAGDTPGDGEFRLELLDDAEGVLHVQYFDPVPDASHVCCGGDPDLAVAASHSAILPFEEDTARLVLYRGADFLTEVVRSPNPPEVAISEPEPGTIWELGDVGLMSWEAADPDEGPLVHIVQYSDDGGRSWSMAAIDVTDTVLEVDADAFAGSNEAAVRILTSDGLNTAEAIIGPFTVRDKPPQIWILSPVEPTTVDEGDALFLEGAGSDYEDGPLPEEALQWVSSEDGPLGQGHWLEIDSLTPGVHEITLRATDEAGHLNQDSTVVEVEAVEHINSQPSANAGPDMETFVDEDLRLDGRQSSDPDGDTLTYHWSVSGQPEGSTVVLPNEGAAQPDFTARLPGVYELSLTVHDGQVGSTPDHVVVRVFDR
ncbi:MAG: PKD domain-containing protein [Trueperaceae bacterium]